MPISQGFDGSRRGAESYHSRHSRLGPFGRDISAHVLGRLGPAFRQGVSQSARGDSAVWFGDRDPRGERRASRYTDARCELSRMSIGRDRRVMCWCASAQRRAQQYASGLAVYEEIRAEAAGFAAIFERGGFTITGAARKFSATEDHALNIHVLRERRPGFSVLWCVSIMQYRETEAQASHPKRSTRSILRATAHDTVRNPAGAWRGEFLKQLRAHATPLGNSGGATAKETADAADVARCERKARPVVPNDPYYATKAGRAANDRSPSRLPATLASYRTAGRTRAPARSGQITALAARRRSVGQLSHEGRDCYGRSWDPMYKNLAWPAKRSGRPVHSGLPPVMAQRVGGIAEPA